MNSKGKEEEWNAWAARAEQTQFPLWECNPDNEEDMTHVYKIFEVAAEEFQKRKRLQAYVRSLYVKRDTLGKSA